MNQLRAIGWAHWNPIGLDGPPDTPADEYDEYLVRAADMIAAHRSLDEVAAYLVRCIEIEMCMSADPHAARLTAETIAAVAQDE